MIMATHVEVAYPGSISRRVDNALERLARQHSGTWVGSGVGIPAELAQRDIEFRFKTAANAVEFVEACRVIPGVIILSGPEDT